MPTTKPIPNEVSFKIKEKLRHHQIKLENLLPLDMLRNDEEGWNERIVDSDSKSYKEVNMYEKVNALGIIKSNIVIAKIFDFTLIFYKITS
jgi:hypothetical protein